MHKNYSYKLFEFDEALTPYGTIETKPPVRRDLCVTDFNDSTATSFHTTIADSGKVCLSTDERLLSLILDESGSMTFNDNNGDRIEFYKDLLRTLKLTYPGQIKINLIGFGGVPVKTELYLSSLDNIDDIGETTFDTLKVDLLSDSVYDFAGVRVVRKSTGYPAHSMDGIIVSDGIFSSVKDSDLAEDTTYYYKIFAYNKYGHFNKGVPVKFTTHAKLLPRGVESFYATARILPGAERDEHTKLILNFSELSGSVLYDSSGNNNHVALSGLDEGPFWSGETVLSDDEKFLKNTGGKFSGQGYLQSVSTINDAILSTSNDITVNFWVYRYASTVEQTIVSVENGVIAQYAVLLNAAGRIHVQGSVVPNLVSNQIIPEKEWTMVSVVFSSNGANLHTEIYIDGTLDTETTSNYPAAITTANVFIGGSTLTNEFMGGISSVSIHNTSRDHSYIASLYAQESKIFYRDVTVNAKEPPDNAQREVLLQWKISDDFDYVGGTVKIVRKYNAVPSNIDDGTAIYQDSAASGDFSYVDSVGLINGSSFYYRFFTINSTGNECDRVEARVAPTYIPISNNPSPQPALRSPSLYTTPGNGKAKIHWDNVSGTVSLPVDSRIKGYRLYYSTRDYPVLSISNTAADPWNIDAAPSSSGTLLIDTTLSSYVHRAEDGVSLKNGTTYFYSIVAYDEKGNTSPPGHATAIPSADYDIILPPDEVSNAWAELVNRRSVSLHWTSPSPGLESVELWFDQTAIFYAKVSDLFGGGIEDLSNFNVSVNQVASRTGTVTAPEKEYQLSFSSESSGLVKGTLIHSLDRELLTNTSKYNFTLFPSFKITDPENVSLPIFEYILPRMTIIYNNPMGISMHNLLNKRVPAIGAGLGASVASLTNEGRPCQDRFCSDENEITNSFTDGGYINSSEPYICRIFVAYRDAAVADGTLVQVSLLQSETDLPAQYAELLNTSYYTQSQEFEDVDSNGRPTGRSVTRSFVDVKMHSPTFPESVDLSAIFVFNGISTSARHPILWATTLKFDLQVSTPRADGIERTEQLCHIYFVDPDDPDNSKKFAPITDDTLVKWELVKGDYFKERPFYSTDLKTQRSAGVYSKTSNGIARNVWFGPVSNIESHVITYQCGEQGGTCCVGEEYQIVAQIIVNGETIKASKWVGYECDSEKTAQTYSKILIDGIKEQPSDGPHYFAYADGESMIHLQVASDPENSDMFYAECFKKCMDSIGSTIIPLPCNQIVNIYTGGLDQELIRQKRYSEAGMEVIWNAEFETDPYTGETVLLPGYSILTPTSSVLSQTEHVAHVPVKSNVTDIYLRWNKFVGTKNPSKCQEGNNLSISSLTKELDEGVGPCESQTFCHELDECPDKFWKWENMQSITCNSLIVANNKVVNMTGGGDYIDGVPPLFVGFTEPLEVKFVDIRVNGVNGQRVPSIVVDGRTRHLLVVKVSFAGRPVPDGTPVYLSVDEKAGADQQSVVVLSSNTVYTHLTHDPLLSSTDDASLAYFEIDPLSDVTFSATISAESTYDKRGDAKREIFAKIEIENTSDEEPELGGPGPQEQPEPNKVKVYSNEVIVYDTITDTYTEYRALLESRAGHFAAIASTSDTAAPATETGFFGSLYLASGFNGNSLISTTEIYEIGGSGSRYSANIPTPRAFGQTALVGTKMYCIGGLEYDAITKTFNVSKRVECFDISTESWGYASEMPTGVAFGSGMTDGTDIYVLCGCSAVTNDCEPQTLNSKILKYDTTGDTWTETEIVNVQLYQRISPFAFKYNGSIYIYGGSVLKDTGYLRAELQTYLDFRVSEYKASLFSSNYYSGRKDLDTNDLIESEKQRILDEEILVSPYHYLTVGFIYNISSQGITELNEQWTVHPTSRDRGDAVFIEDTSTAYFIGGSGETSTTIGKNESVNLSTGEMTQKSSMARGRTLLRTNLAGSSIYITGGLTSGHQENWASIECRVLPDIVEARGKQTSNLLIVLRDDSGEIIDRDVPVLVRGYLKIPGISDSLAAKTIENSVARIFYQSENNISKLNDYLNNVVNPNSDEFQFNSAQKINEDVSLFPVLFTKSRFNVHGTTITTLLPRSEDPFSELQSLSKSLTSNRQNVRDSIKADASGSTAADQINALESILASAGNDFVQIESGVSRDLYEIEIQVTILDDTYFGQNVLRSDLNTLQGITNSIRSKINQIEKDEDAAKSVSDIGDGYSFSANQTDDSLYVQRDSTRSGQNASSKCLFGVSSFPRHQSQSPVIKYYNNVDWVPQIKSYITDNAGTPDEGIDELTLIGDDVPFGSSQLYTAIVKTAQIMTDTNFTGISKNIYINSDNYQNLSSYTLDQAITEVNSIDGEDKVPIIYTVFSTAYPTTVSTQLARSQTGDVEELVTNTGGHSTVLTSSDFLNDVLNFVVSVSGGLGYGLYRKTIDLGYECTVTKFTSKFELYSNTSATVRYRSSLDGRTWSLWSEYYSPNTSIVIADLQARYIEMEATLKSGFIEDINDPYINPTGIPCLTEFCIEYSSPREDFLLMNYEDANGTVQQAISTIAGTVPTGAAVTYGIASSDADGWDEFHSDDRPASPESKKTVYLDRDKNTLADDTVLRIDELKTKDGIIFTASYGPWSESAAVTVYEPDADGNDIVLSSSNYKTHPRDGQIIAGTKYPTSKTMKISIECESKVKVALRLLNSNHESGISLEGAGYMYSTNQIRQEALTQMPPKVSQVKISPASPNALSTISVTYKYTDLNRDKESSSLIRWYRNGSPMMEINDKITWTNSELVQANKLKIDDILTVSVTPGDGRDFGDAVISSGVKIVSVPPVVESAKLTPYRNGVINSRTDTSSVIMASYDFETSNSGETTIEVGTTISWYVNGLFYRQSVYNTGDDEYIAKSLFPYEQKISDNQTINDILIYAIGSQVYCEVTPKTKDTTGATIRTNTVTIQNSIPIAKDLRIIPNNPTVITTLEAQFLIDDNDFALSGQKNATEVKWYQSSDGIAFTEEANLRNSMFVAPSLLKAGSRWYFRVTPHDGLEFGSVVSSTSVIILPV